MVCVFYSISCGNFSLSNLNVHLSIQVYLFMGELKKINDMINDMIGLAVYPFSTGIIFF